MKYIAPTLEITAVEVRDIITASSDVSKVEDNNDGSGNVIFNALKLFS